MKTMEDSVHAIILRNKDRAGLADRIEAPRSRWARFQALRELYQKINEDDWEPYPVDWMQVFTKIEQMVWSDLRCAGVNMWPQYPVGRRFVDFADPKKRIAIECDGKDWHDEQSDYERDLELAEMGWIVFRIPGSACMRTLTSSFEEFDEYETENERKRITQEKQRWMRITSEGFIEAMSVFYYGRSMPHQCLTMDDVTNVLSDRASPATPFCDIEEIANKRCADGIYP